MKLCENKYWRFVGKNSLERMKKVIANESVSRDKFVFSLGVPFEFKCHHDCNFRHLVNALTDSINIVRLSLFM